MDPEMFAVIHDALVAPPQAGYGYSFNSMHEAYATFAEKLEDLWRITKQTKQQRSAVDIRKVQVDLISLALRLTYVRNLLDGEGPEKVRR